ncbi:linear amide C-N hydrolase [Alginatibacterium sediminis]|uniref:Linear amide C-N hydrolase n=1 Tax=Alginatibacterium sediminis TaxID=2164068 RepID=A0A420E8G6_9ALTE|nr:linear amide C-N hydrolase [Alginatibacterium sediminis]RKF15690.1 linear amide C-N hydrolase [Alginatibacterium sediminis]
MKKLLLTAAIAATLASSVTHACSYFHFDTPQNNTIIGRTMEIGFEAQETFFVAPRGYQLNDLPASKYGYVGIRHGATEWVSSAINEHGLNAESLALGASQYTAEDSTELGVNYLNLGAYILGNAKSVDEAVALLKTTKVETTKIEAAFDLEAGMHYAFNDGERSIVVEYTDGSGYPDIHENTLGAMTNDPIYDVQVGEAHTLLDGGSYEEAKVKFAEGSFKGFDKSPMGRFQHIVAMNHTQDNNVIENDLDGVNRGWHMVNALEIPRGSLYWRWLSDDPQMVGYSIVVDTNNNDYYFRTYDNQQIRKVDLDSINFAKVDYQEESIFSTITEYQPMVIN